MVDETAAPMRVLIIDDNVKVGALVAEIFEKLGFDCAEHTCSGKEALALLQENEYALVVCDMNLGDTDGMAVLKEIKGDDRLYQTGFILSETTFTAKQIMQAHRAGADGFLLKPFSISLLRQKLRQIMRPTSLRRRYAPDWAQANIFA